MILEFSELAQIEPKYDQSFYRRQQELHQIRDDIKNGKIEMISHDDFWNEIDGFIETLDKMIQRGLEDVKNRRTISDKEMEKQIAQW